MTFDIYFKVFFPALFALMALFFLLLGLRGILAKRPFLISARWFLAIMLIAFVPGMIQPFLFSFPRIGGALGAAGLLMWLNPIMLAVILVFMWLMMRGYMAFAVTAASFREGLLFALDQRGLAHEETLSTMRLPSIGADLQVAIQGWIGTGQIKVRPRKFGPLLAEIAREMNEYYRATGAAVNLTCCVFYVILGVFMAVMGVAFLLMKSF